MSDNKGEIIVILIIFIRDFSTENLKVYSTMMV